MSKWRLGQPQNHLLHKQTMHKMKNPLSSGQKRSKDQCFIYCNFQ